MKLVRILVATLLATVNASFVLAQEPILTPTAMGQNAAADESVVAYFISGVIGGSGIGITSAHYLRADRDETPYWPAIAGVTIVLGTGVAIEIIGPKPPYPQFEAAGSAEYQQAFRERIQSRRRNALALGSILGIATGVAIHVTLYGVGR